jgi:hypothetical protein
VFTARYALGPYIKQIRFVFKGLIPEKRPGTHCTEMPGAPQGRSGRFGEEKKSLVLTGFEPPTVHPVSYPGSFLGLLYEVEKRPSVKTKFLPYPISATKQYVGFSWNSVPKVVVEQSWVWRKSAQWQAYCTFGHNDLLPVIYIFLHRFGSNLA